MEGKGSIALRARAGGRLTLAAVVACAIIALPVLFALAPGIASALGTVGRYALVIGAGLAALGVGALARMRASRAGGAALARFDRRVAGAGAAAAVAVLAIFPLQLSVFALAWPPPGTAAEYFGLLADNRLVGLLSLDLLLMVDWLVLLVLWSALYVTLRPTAPRLMAVAFGLTLVATLMYFASNTAFEMLALSAQHAAAGSEAERAALLADGEASLRTFEGVWFTASYVLSGLATLLASLAMWRAPVYGKLVGGIGVAYALMQLVPPNMGTVGMALSLLSLIPMLAWLALVARRLLALARGDAAGHGARATLRGGRPSTRGA